MKYSVKIRC